MESLALQAFGTSCLCACGTATLLNHCVKMPLQASIFTCDIIILYSFLLQTVQLKERRITKMKIQESAENYLETILILKKRKGAVRSIDIANEMDFSKPSVSVAMKHLRENGYISVDAGGYITLLDEGLKIAEKIYERHTLLSNWLVSLGVSPQTAAEDACRREHAISEESFEALKKRVF